MKLDFLLNKNTLFGSYLLTSTLDRELTFIGVLEYGPQIEGNPIIRRFLETNPLYALGWEIIGFILIYFGLNLIWKYGNNFNKYFAWLIPLTRLAVAIQWLVFLT